jgi:hypothetical protein
MRGTSLSGLALAASLVVGCSSDGDTAPTGPLPYTPTPLPSLDSAPLTDAQVLLASHAVLPGPDPRSPAEPDARAAMLAEGYGETTTAAGQAHLGRTPDGQPPPAPGPSPRLLVRFAHLADVQLVDDESPARLASFDGPGAVSGAFRPQDAHQCRILNAGVRTLAAVHASLPLSFVLLGGDNIDSAQPNELAWLLAILDGAPRVECDSGADDDPVPGPDDDAKDPFVAAGLPVPWYWVTGNHDVLRQGTLPVTADQVALSLGTEAPGGTRDWTAPGGPVFGGPVAADAGRRLLSRQELGDLVAADGDGHGLASAWGGGGKAFYTFDVPGTALRFVVLDTGAETGSADGLLRVGDVEGFVRPALDQALVDGRWVVLASHHSAGALSDGGGVGGDVQPDAVPSADWLSLLGGYPNVLFSLVGHSHVHRARFLQPAVGHGWWEVTSAALADWPHQARVIELWDQDDGWVILRATSLDYSTESDPVAAEGRELGVLDYVAGWADDGRGSAEDQNVEIWIAAPP